MANQPLGLVIMIHCPSHRALPGASLATLETLCRAPVPRSNTAVERDSQKAVLFGSLRASRSGCPSLLRWKS